LQDADAAGLVYHARYAPTLGRIRDRLPRLRLLLQVDSDSGEPLLPGDLEYEAVLAAASPAGPAVACSADDLYILYTGGTTGAPKGVLWRQEDIYFAAMSGQPPGVPPPATIPELVARAANGAYLRSMPTPPLMHGAAQWAAFGALHQGGTVVLQGRPERLDPDDVWGTVERERVNLLVLVGDAFARPLLDGLDRRSYDLSGLFVIVSGGAILSPHLKQALLECLPHATVIDGFGASETGGHGTRTTRAGEPATTGTFSMADTVVLREDLSGALAPGSPEVVLGAAMGHVPPGAHATHEELVDFAAPHLARYKLPKTTVWVDEIARSPSGKPDYRWARTRARAARGLAPE